MSSSELPIDGWVRLERTAPHDCPYLPEREARLAFGLARPDGSDFDRLMASGYRRLGQLFYRPDCAGCSECRPIRVPLDGFRRSRSQRRLWRKQRDAYQVRLLPPHFSGEHFAIYARHSQHVSTDNEPATPEGYRRSFVDSCVQTHMLEYRTAPDGELVGVSVLDEGEQCLSSVYVYWDPRFAARSPGTFSALWEMAWAYDRGLRYYYLGYWVCGCSRMSYKSRFRPHQLYDWQRCRWVDGQQGGGQ